MLSATLRCGFFAVRTTAFMGVNAIMGVFQSAMRIFCCSNPFYHFIKIWNDLVSIRDARVALNIREIFGSEMEGLCDGIVAVETAPIQIPISSRSQRLYTAQGAFWLSDDTKHTHFPGAVTL